jgi:hypothetical protein
MSGGLVRDLDCGQGAGKATSETVAPQARHGSARDTKSRAHAWPRLLSEAEAGEYLGIGADLIGEYVRAGLLRLVRLPRPDTVRDQKRAAVLPFVRRRLIDRHELDRLVDRIREEEPA